MTEQVLERKRVDLGGGIEIGRTLESFSELDRPTKNLVNRIRNHGSLQLLMPPSDQNHEQYRLVITDITEAFAKLAKRHGLEEFSVTFTITELLQNAFTHGNPNLPITLEWNFKNKRARYVSVAHAGGSLFDPAYWANRPQDEKTARVMERAISGRAGYGIDVIIGLFKRMNIEWQLESGKKVQAQTKGRFFKNPRSKKIRMDGAKTECFELEPNETEWRKFDLPGYFKKVMAARKDESIEVPVISKCLTTKSTAIMRNKSFSVEERRIINDRRRKSKHSAKS